MSAHASTIGLILSHWYAPAKPAPEAQPMQNEQPIPHSINDCRWQPNNDKEQQ